VGSRFWPLSRQVRPKQFLDILGTGKSLLQQTFERFRNICPTENIYIVTNEDYNETILEQLPEIEQEQVLLEPMRKNTAPCIAYANYKILSKNPDAIIVVAPSDHLIIKEEEFTRVIKEGLKFTSENNALLTLGIKPHRPETGYGYIQINKEVSMDRQENLKKVKTFTEKPNLEMAKVFLESGDFFWNSGIFIWSLKSINEAFELYLPNVNTLFKSGIDKIGTDEEGKFINTIYPKCMNISIDYGVMEKANNVYVYCSDFGWSDLGTWGSLFDHTEKDKNGNAVIGENAMMYSSSNCVVNLPKNKLAVLQGLDNYVIVETEDVLLICKKQDEQQIKQFVKDVKLEKGEEYI
ncbi:mannose-1-phosphate guanylyltransferase, partial [Bacteroidota bacterium]